MEHIKVKIKVELESGYGKDQNGIIFSLEDGYISGYNAPASNEQDIRTILETLGKFLKRNALDLHPDMALVEMPISEQEEQELEEDALANTPGGPR